MVQEHSRAVFQDLLANLAQPVSENPKMRWYCVVCRRGKWMQADADSSMFEVVSTTDWLQLLSRHAAGQEDGIRFASLSPASSMLDNLRVLGV